MITNIEIIETAIVNSSGREGKLIIAEHPEHGRILVAYNLPCASAFKGDRVAINADCLAIKIRSTDNLSTIQRSSRGFGEALYDTITRNSYGDNLPLPFEINERKVG